MELNLRPTWEGDYKVTYSITLFPRSVKFKPRSFREFITETQVTLSGPFHRNSKIIFSIC